jgi:hypothetical protein
VRRRILAVELVDLPVGDLRGLDEAASELLAHGIDVDATRTVGVLGVRLDDMDVEEEPGFALGREPVDSEVADCSETP